MKQPQQTQPSRTAPSGPNALSLTSPQSALCNVPQVLERSTRSLADAKKCTGAVTGPGVLVKLYPVGDLWIVGSPHTKRWIPSKVDNMRTANANAEANDKNKASQPAKPRSVFAHKAKAQLISEKAATQKHLRSRTQRAEKVTEQQVQEAQDESDKMNTKPEEEEDEEEGEDTEEEDAREEDVWEDDVREDDVREEDAGEEDAVEEDEEEKEEEHAEDEDACHEPL